MERTFIMVKPDGVQRKLVGQIINRFERRGLTLQGLKLMNVAEDLARRHYAEHEGKPFFDSLINYITSSAVVAMVWAGDNAVSIGRSMLGATNPVDASPGTVRGDFAIDIGRNVAHGSASVEDAEREISLFFASHELVGFVPVDQKWIYE